MPVSSTLLHNTARVTGLPRWSTVPTTIAFGSATPARSASANQLRNSATQPSASHSASRSGLPSFSTDPYSTRILTRCSSSRVATRQRYAAPDLGLIHAPHVRDFGYRPVDRAEDPSARIGP